jgi:hypothetical protein
VKKEEHALGIDELIANVEKRIKKNRKLAKIAIACAIFSLVLTVTGLILRIAAVTHH